MTKAWWSDKQYRDLLCYRAQGLTRPEIAEIMGRSLHAIDAKLRDGHGKERVYKTGFIHDDYKQIEIPEHVLAERDHRLGLQPRDITAAFCGDPLPGFSALERRHG